MPELGTTVAPSKIRARIIGGLDGHIIDWWHLIQSALRRSATD